jgi:hypothetical protein
MLISFTALDWTSLRYVADRRCNVQCIVVIVFLATRLHIYTVETLVNGTFGVALPEVGAMPYEAALLAETLPRATYVFTDIERLSVWERILAAELYLKLQDAGCRCLNDPARVMTRYTLLRALHHAGINPFRIWRLDDAILDGMTDPAAPAARASWLRRKLGRAADRPSPNFPVFLRTEADHDRPLTEPLHSPAELAEAVARIRHAGVAPSGVMMIEYCSEELAEGVWAKFGTMRIGNIVSTDHAVIENDWCVKQGTTGLATTEMFAWENRQVATNAYEAALRRPFAVGGIDYGRADHATVGGREVIYEINTNPYLAPFGPQTRPIREETLRVARERFAAGLHAIDGATGATLRIAQTARGRRQADFGSPAMLFRP